MANQLTLSDFDFQLPPDRIALRPTTPRSAARLLIVKPEAPLEARTVDDLPELLSPGDTLVFNDTRVIPARLFGARERNGSSAAVEATLHRRLAPNRWSAFMRPGKRLLPSDRIRFAARTIADDGAASVQATLVDKGEGGEVTLDFDLTGPELDTAIRAIGLTPLPPYIADQRAEDEQDRFDYQTVYAREDGSVAAPTAGLHFTPQLLERLAERGVQSTFVTLHVGAGTFKPVKTDDLKAHRMHAEYGELSAEAARALNAARARNGRIICVGTTSLRLLESAVNANGEVCAFSGETDIFIQPGYKFRIADALMTNFHLPRSTLLMLVAAFCGLDTVKTAYAHALAAGYRFYSYGDAGLWFRAPD